MKKAILLSLLFLFSFVAFVIYLAPASVVLGFAQDRLPSNIKVAGVTGSLWQGQIQQLVVNRQAVENVKWQLNVASLFTGQIRADVNLGKLRNFDVPYGKTTVSLPFSATGVKFDNLDLRVPAQLVSAQVKLPMALPVQGNIKLKAQQAEFPLNGSQICSRVQGVVETHKLAVQGLQGWIDINEIAGDLGCRNGALTLNVHQENQLGLQLEAEYGLQTMSASGFVKPDASMPKQVHDAVKFMGRPDASGRYAFKF